MTKPLKVTGAMPASSALLRAYVIACMQECAAATEPHSIEDLRESVAQWIEDSAQEAFTTLDAEGADALAMNFSDLELE